LATTLPKDTETPTLRDVRFIDCDIHLKPLPQVLERFLPEPWRSRPTALRPMIGRGSFYAPYTGGNRTDATPDGGPPGSNPEIVGQQLFVDAEIDFAINIPSGPPFSSPLDPDLNAAATHAINEWQAATWLSEYNTHGRYKGSIIIPMNNPPMAVREIEKWVGHPHFVQICVPNHAGVPLGDRQFHPIWEAAARARLPVAMHVNRGGADPMITPVGFLQRYGEFNGIGFPMYYMSHLISFISEGVFTRYPDFRVVFVEGGFSWVGPIMSRLDANWRLLRSEVPEVAVLPSTYLRDHVRFSSQPVDDPEDVRDLVDVYEWCDARHLLMFSTDYPHWDFDNPSRAIPARLGDALRRRIYVDNAREFYELPGTRSRDEFDQKLENQNRRTAKK